MITHVSHESISITSSRPFCSRLNMQMCVHRGPYCAQLFYTDPDWISKRERNSHQCPSFFHIRSYTVHTHLYRILITKWPADDKTSKVVNHLPWRKNRPDGLVIKRKILETYLYNRPVLLARWTGCFPGQNSFWYFCWLGRDIAFVFVRKFPRVCVCVYLPPQPKKVFTSYEQGVYNVLLLRYYIYTFTCVSHTDLTTCLDEGYTFKRAEKNVSWSARFFKAFPPFRKTTCQSHSNTRWKTLLMSL